jgi:hypothetical protein
MRRLVDATVLGGFPRTQNYLLDYGSGFRHKSAMAQKKEAPTPAPPPEPPPTKAG